MKSKQEVQEERYRLTPFLSPFGAWSYGVGTAIGWGSFVVTSNAYLLQGGPMGSVAGIVAGTLIMIAIACNYSYLMRRYPSAGGSYTYVSHVLGKDRGFLTGWYLSLTYMAIFWANATSVPLFARYFFGDHFVFGYLYTIFGYDIYLGEVALTLGAIALISLLCLQDKHLKARIMVVLASVFTGGIIICFVASLVGLGKSGHTMQPAVLPDVNVLRQILKVSLMMPWAFIGFESISHSTEEFNFSQKKIPSLTLSVVITTAVLYAMVILMSVTAYPSQYDSWFAYLKDLGNLQGIEALPPFYAASCALGNAGVNILICALLALIITSLIGNLVALSRLFVALGRDNILPERFTELNGKGTPQRAVLSAAAVSMLIPFLGRTAIGWIVDITTIGAIIIYGLVSFSARKAAHSDNDALHHATGTIGTVAMIFLGLVIVLPDLLASGSMAQETYFLLATWSILGFVYLRVIMIHDKTDTFGQSVMVWIVMVSFVLFSSVVWLQKANMTNAQEAVDEISAHFRNMGLADEQALEAIVQQSMTKLEAANLKSTLISIALFVFAIGMMMSNYAFVRKRNEQSRQELGAVKEAYNRDPLTGVKSKHAFAEAERDMNTHITNHDVGEFGVVVFDVNGLKYINDTLGHKAGDDYICVASCIICAHFKHSPVFRTGGDEFVAILRGHDYDHRTEICTDFDREVEGNIGTTKAVVSAGLSVFDPELDTTFHEVFERADALMYQRKMQLKSMGAKTRD